MKKYLTGTLLLVGSVILLLGFQNCGGKKFSSSGESEVLSEGSGFIIGGGDGGDGIGEMGTVDVKTDNDIVEISGKCSSGANYEISGDVSGTSVLPCKETGVINYCGLMQNNYADNEVVVKDDATKVVIGTHTVVKLLVSPTIIFTMDTFEKESFKMVVTGKCNPGSNIKLNIYNNDIANVTCTMSGTYTYENVKLVRTTPRILFATQTTPFGVTTNIYGNADGESDSIQCSISSVVANPGICSEQAGTVKGKCHKGLPVSISVNGVAQRVGVCDSKGEFSVDRVLIDSLGASNAVKVEQKDPYGNTCSDAKDIYSF